MLKVGWASRDIIPSRPAMLQGQMYRRVAREAADPITCTALAIEGGTPGDAALFISLDMVHVSESLLALVRERLSRTVPSLPSRNVIMHATHTHTSLVVEDGLYEHPGGDVMTPGECREFVAVRAADAAAEAWNSRAPQMLSLIHISEPTRPY